MSPEETQRLLEKLTDLRGVPEVDAGFKSQRDCLSWAAQVEPLLRYNPVLQVRFSATLHFLHGNLSGTGVRQQFSQLVTTLESAIQELKHDLEASQPHPVKLGSPTSDYVALSRITELKSVNSPKFDLTRLVQMCRELNSCRRDGNLISIVMLCRAIIDHVPPILGYGTFNEVANNYGAGGKSFKESMDRLNTSSRKIADQHLHQLIRASEVLPSSTQVDFSNDLDVLLGEVVRILK